MAEHGCDWLDEEGIFYIIFDDILEHVTREAESERDRDRAATVQLEEQVL